MSEPHALRLPADFLADLSARCGRAGREATAALREAGSELGGALLEELPEDRRAAEAAPAAFWETVSGMLNRRGLGRLGVEVRTESVAELRLREGPEGTDVAGHGCPFTTGLLAGLLTGAAGEPVAVLEVACSSDGEPACRWLAGAESSLEPVLRSLEEGAPVSEALRGP